MIADFSVLFSINRATSTYSIVLTDTSTGVTDIKGNFKITFPDGSVYHNTDFTSPDISAPGAGATITAKTQSSDGEVMRGTYEIIYTALDVDDDIVDGNTKTFNFSFDEPNLIITNTSDVALPSVGFSCDTDITSTDYTGVISTFSMSSDFPSTSDVSSETATQDLTVSRDLDQVFSGNYYEGLYNPVVDLTVAYTSATYAYLSVQFIDQVTSAFNIYAIQTASELLTLIETFKTQESADKNPYNRAMALYSNIESSAREGVAAEGNNLLSELLSILNVSNVHAFQSGPISGLDLIFSEVNDLTASVTWADVPDANITESSVTQHEGALDHNSLANYAADEHIDWTDASEDLMTTGTGEFTSAILVRGTGSNAGGVRFYEKLAGTNYIELRAPDAITTTGLIRLPDASGGTLALLSDIFTPDTLLADYGFTDNSSNWNTAFGWGDHEVAQYGWHGYDLSDETSDLEVGQVAQNVFFPFSGQMENIIVIVDPTNAPTGSTIIVDVKKNGTTIFSTKITIDATEWSSLTAATAYVLSTNPTTFTSSDYFTVHIDQVGSTNAGSAGKIFFKVKAT